MPGIYCGGYPALRADHVVDYAKEVFAQSGANTIWQDQTRHGHTLFTSRCQEGRSETCDGYGPGKVVSTARGSVGEPILSARWMETG